MGIFSSIGKAVGGLVKSVVPAVGTFFGGPIGGAVGSVLSSGLDFLDDNIGSIAQGVGQYYSAEQANEATAERLAQQQGYNVTNAASANAFTERMLERQGQINSGLQQRQFAENQFLVDQSIRENRASQQRAMDFTSDLSSTAYQRATADLQKAGLNRILAVTQGGASTPGAPAPSAPTGSASSASVGSGSGAMASASVLPAIEKLGPAIATAAQMRRLDQELTNMRAQETLLRSQSRNVDAQTLTELERPELTRAQKYTEWQRPAAVDAEAARSKALRDLAVQQEKTEKSETRIREREAEDTEKYGTSKLGREAAALLRMFDTIWAELRGAR